MPNRTLLSAGPLSQGLTSRKAQEMQNIYGENRLSAKSKNRPLLVFIGQFKDIMTVILLIATVLSVLLGEGAESIAILIIVFVNALLGFFQEYRTEKALERLKNMAAPTSHVLRDGVWVTLPADELTVGDVVQLSAGDRVPADGILLWSVSLQADESLLTGESIAVEKLHAQEEKVKAWLSQCPETGPLPEWPVASQRVYMGSIVTRGRGGVLVTGVGMTTQMGQVAGMLGSIEEEPTPLQKRLGELGKYIAIGCLLVCVIVAVAGLLRGEPLLDMLLVGISLAVAAVPEGLPAIVTISLAMAVGRIYKRAALVKKLHAVETLGCANVICSDKTGTLTENRMTVKAAITGSGRFAFTGNGYESKGTLLAQGHPVSLSAYPELQRAIGIAVLCNNGALRRPVKSETNYSVQGDATETALLVAGAKCGLYREELQKQFSILSETPFDSERKRMSIVVQPAGGGTSMLWVKGAPDLLLERCAFYAEKGTAFPMTSQRRQLLQRQNTSLAEEALRVIGVAYREIKQGEGTHPVEENLIFAGFFGMLDPPRKEAPQAVKRCREAGIRPVMITGDHIATARAIAGQVGIYHPGEPSYTGQELDRMEEEAFAQAARTANVFARVSPAHKLRLVRALKKQGNVVAMTGDGVNDAPAIKEADIGVAMGQSGTDVTKEAASMILLDDNFATLVASVEEGRTIYQNIRKFIRYLLSCNIGEVLTMFLGMLMGMPVILLPIQILLVNLVTDGLPAIALGLDPTEPDTMSQPPRGITEGVFSHGLAGLILFRGCLIGLTTLAVFVSLFRYGGLETARTGAFVALVLNQLIHVFECKSEKKGLLHIPILNNKKLLLAVLTSLLVLFTAVYFPPCQPIFSTVSLRPQELLMVIGYCLCGPILAGLVRLPGRVEKRRSMAGTTEKRQQA